MPATILDLPKKLLLNIFCRLSSRDLLRVSHTCQRFYEVSFNETLHKRILHGRTDPDRFHCLRWLHIQMIPYIEEAAPVTQADWDGLWQIFEHCGWDLFKRTMRGAKPESRPRIPATKDRAKRFR